MARSLSRAERDRELPIRIKSVLGFVDVDKSINPNWSWYACDGSVAKFVSRLWLSNIASTELIFDELSMVRAHVALPVRRRSVCFFHGIDVWENAHQNRIAASRKVDILLTNSQYTKVRADECHRGFARAKVCWLGTETDDIEGDVVRGLGDRPKVLVLGRMQIGRDKGHRALLSSWVKVVRACPDAELLIVGKGSDLSALVDYSKVLGLNSYNVKFLGFLTDGEMDAVWRQVWVFAMPSRGEGFGLVYVEAMQRGVPVIASVHDAAVEVNEDGGTGFNVSLDQESDLTERLIQMLSDKGLCLRMGERARERWREYFTFSAFHERFTGALRGGVCRG